MKFCAKAEQGLEMRLSCMYLCFIYSAVYCVCYIGKLCAGIWNALLSLQIIAFMVLLVV